MLLVIVSAAFFVLMNEAQIGNLSPQAAPDERTIRFMDRIAKTHVRISLPSPNMTYIYRKRKGRGKKETMCSENHTIV